MTKASDNAFPSILITEGTEPSAPAAGKQRLYIDSTTHKLKRTDSSGTDVTVEGGLADQGVVTYLDFTTAAAPSSPAAGKIRVYSKTGDTLAQKTSGGTETVFGAGGGGGSDLVQTNAGAGSVYVPGLRGSPDAKPASPASDDDEFEAFSGWTTLGSLGTSNVTDVPSHWHVAKANVGLQIHGIYKTAPSTPFTVTVKLADYIDNGNYTEYGLALGDSTPTAWDSVTFSKYPTPWTIQRDTWTNNTSRSGSSNGSATGSSLQASRYLRLVVASTSSVTASFSDTGLLWTPSGLGTYNPGFASKIAIVVSANGVAAEAFVDWIRFT